MSIKRSNLQLCEAVASALTATDPIPALVIECANAETLREDILRDRLKVHGVPTAKAEAFIAQYEAEKYKK
jgi:hypothetical protein